MFTREYKVKTIAQYKILMWLDKNNFEEGKFEVTFISSNSALVTDDQGDCLKLTYTDTGIICEDA